MGDIPLWILWLGVMVIMLVIEGATANLVTIWFAISALITLVMSLLGVPLLWQVVVFVVLSFVLVMLTRPLVKKLLKNRQPTNADRHIGQRGIVIMTIDPITGKGQVKVDGVIWSAKSHDGTLIEEGYNVEVLDITGVKLVVKTVSANIQLG